MRAIALRFAEDFAPDCGTIEAHLEMIRADGFVWYGKLGSPVSEKVAKEILSSDNPKILLIQSGGQNRYWAQVTDIRRSLPDLNHVPAYYRSFAGEFKCWFKVEDFELASRDVMSKCTVASSGKSLSLASRHSMSPYFIIEVKDDRK